MILYIGILQVGQSIVPNNGRNDSSILLEKLSFELS